MTNDVGQYNISRINNFNSSFNDDIIGTSDNRIDTISSTH